MTRRSARRQFRTAGRILGVANIAIVASATTCDDREPDLMSSIRTLIAAQASHHARTGAFATTARELPTLALATGVSLQSMEASATTWVASIEAPAERRRCTVRGELRRNSGASAAPKVTLDCRDCVP